MMNGPNMGKKRNTDSEASIKENEEDLDKIEKNIKKDIK